MFEDPRNRLIYHLRGLLDGLPLECCSSEIREKSLKTRRNTPENTVYLQNHNTLQGEFCLRTGTNTPEGDYPFSAGTSTSGNPPSSVWWVRGHRPTASGLFERLGLPQVGVILIAIFISVLVSEWVSAKVRHAIICPPDQRRLSATTAATAKPIPTQFLRDMRSRQIPTPISVPSNITETECRL